MAEQFEGFYIGHVSCQDNTHADTLASLATSLCLQAGECRSVMVFARSLFHPKWTLSKVLSNPIQPVYFKKHQASQPRLIPSTGGRPLSTILCTITEPT